MTAARRIPSEKTTGLFEEILAKGPGLRVRVTGRSMSPFLRGGEVLTIKSVPYSSLRIGDLIFFKNSDGNSVVHRIIRKRKGEGNAVLLQTKGDAGVSFDEPVSENNVLGKVCGIEGTGSFIDMEKQTRRLANYMIAITHLIKSGLYRIVALCRPPFRTAR